jgi:hypothetical protein
MAASADMALAPPVGAPVKPGGALVFSACPTGRRPES